MKKICILALLLCSSCGSVVNKTNEANPSVSTPSGDVLVVFNSNYTDPIGNLSTIDIAANMSAQFARVTTDGSDAVIRSYGGRIYIINRFGTDTIQVVNSADFSVAADFSVGPGSNPQDIVVVSDDKAYVSRLDSQNDSIDTSDVLIVNPATGERRGGVDLKPYTTEDGERLARAAQMILIGNYLYVCIQDLPANMLLSADTNGKVAVIDIDSDTVVDTDPDTDGKQAIELAGRNPSDIAYVPETDKLIIADSGVYDNFVINTSDSNGGIEIVDRENMTSEGIVIDDTALGGGVAEVRVASEALAFTIVDSRMVASFNPTTHEIISTSVYTTTWRYLPDITVDSQGRLFVAEQDYQNPGVVVINVSDGTKIAGPIAVGSLPVSMTFVNNWPDTEDISGGISGPDDDAGDDEGGGEFLPPPPPAGEELDPCQGFAQRVVSFAAGAGSGFGRSLMPDIVLGPPRGAGRLMGSLDVVSLGQNGEIVLDLGNCRAVNGPGFDLIVFENAFLIGGDPASPYRELGVVGVSEDGGTFVDFACQDTAYPYTGCAGWHPVYSNPSNDISPFDADNAGGDAFDLFDLGIAEARYIRIRDISGTGSGFDLDAIAVINGIIR